MKSNDTPPSFAETLSELEIVANKLEYNDTPLEQSLHDFQKSIELI